MKTIRILWEAAVKGTVRAENGTVPEACRTVSGCEAVVSLTDTVTAAGPYATLVHVESDLPFSFFLRDVTRENPLYLPRQGAVVTTGDDGRSYKQIVAGILAQNRLSKRRRQAEEPEYSFDRAARETLDLKGPVWLGISRDMRLFQVALHGRTTGYTMRSGRTLPRWDTAGRICRSWKLPPFRSACCPAAGSDAAIGSKSSLRRAACPFWRRQTGTTA